MTKAAALLAASVHPPSAACRTSAPRVGTAKCPRSFPGNVKPATCASARPASCSSLVGSWNPRQKGGVSLGQASRGLFCPGGVRRRGAVRASNGDIESFYQTPKKQSEPKDNSFGIFWLLVANFAVFALDNWMGLPWVKSLYLNGAHPQWWQFLTCTFCHYDWAHLSQNAFFLYVFGKFVEEEEGAAGVVSVYLLCGLGGALASYFLGGAVGYSLGASGAVFGLFTVSCLVKLRLNFRKLLEFSILGQFVFKQVATEVQSQAAIATSSKIGSLVVGGVQVSHMAHLGGALMGVVLVLLLSRLPEAK